MPIIAPQRKPERQPLTIKLDVRLLTLLKAYAECIASSQEYIVNEALLVTFTRDQEFRAWLTQTHPADALALVALVAERPGGKASARPVRTLAGSASGAASPLSQVAAAGQKPRG